jgi:hypothetical protein
MPILPTEAYNMQLPAFHKVRQLFPDEKIANIRQALHSELSSPAIDKSSFQGAKTAVLVGSRGITDINIIVGDLIQHLKAWGAIPFIVPCMGSHGSADARMQQKILEGLGITEESMGARILSGMDTTIIGRTMEGVPVHADNHVLQADLAIPVNRIKKHTDYDGELESGLVKMLTVGLGKHNGCFAYHREGLGTFPQLLPEAASLVLQRIHVPFGLAIVENAHEHTHTLRALPGAQIIHQERTLLELSKSLMPYLRFRKLDVLIVEKMGKDLSGAGMDPSVTGRTTYGRSSFYKGPEITRLIVHELSQESHGNAIGVGFADFITKKLYDSIDLESTYANVIACTNLSTGNIPLIMPDEKTALIAALQSIVRINPEKAKIVRIPDTLHLTEISVSDHLLRECADPSVFEILK